MRAKTILNISVVALFACILIYPFIRPKAPTIYDWQSIAMFSLIAISIISCCVANKESLLLFLGIAVLGLVIYGLIFLNIEACGYRDYGKWVKHILISEMTAEEKFITNKCENNLRNNEKL